MYQAIRMPNRELLARLLNSADHRIRAAGTRVIGHWHSSLANPRELLAARIADEHPRVRLEAVRVLGQMPPAPRGQLTNTEIALRALDQPTDRFLNYALWLTCRETQQDWVPRIQAGTFSNRSEHMIFACQAVGSGAVVAPLVGLLRAGKISNSQQMDATAQLVASLGTANDLRLLFDLAVDEKAPLAQQAALLSALRDGARRGAARPEGKLDRLRSLLESDNPTIAGLAAECSGLWKVTALRDSLMQLTRNRDKANSLRRSAVRGLTAFGDNASRHALALP